MPNQEPSPPNTSLTGFIGPIEAMWVYFRDMNGISDQDYNEKQLESMRFIHYTSCMQMYNAFVMGIRLPDYLPVMSAAMKKDLDNYFGSGAEIH